MVRIHRLWELYLADTTGLQESEWHTRADHLEHTVSETEISALSQELGNPLHDPHGDPIPTEDGELVTKETVPLPEAPLNRPLRIVHIEDEPTVVYKQIVAESLSPGTIVRVLEKDPQRIRLWAEGSERVLAPSLANNIGVVPVPKKHVADVERELVDSSRLNRLRPGERAKVVGISRACRGPERRRLMDLGFVPGTCVEVAMVSPSQDPTAYLVRGTLIALRREQAGWIQVSPREEASA
jgi:DtxR family Mn-dependent transcriptional regulator